MMRDWWGLLRDTVSRWSGHKDARLGAALSYYSIFSLGPLIVIAIAIAGLVFGAEAVQAQIFGTLRGLLGESGTQAIDAMLKGANQPREGLIATIIGVGTLVFAAVGVMVQLKDAMNTVWEVETPPGSGFWRRSLPSARISPSSAAARAGRELPRPAGIGSRPHLGSSQLPVAPVPPLQSPVALLPAMPALARKRLGVVTLVMVNRTMMMARAPATATTNSAPAPRAACAAHGSVELRNGLGFANRTGLPQRSRVLLRTRLHTRAEARFRPCNPPRL
jgi:hypothetical protein